MVVVLVSMRSAPARADDPSPAEHKGVGVGFHNIEAPLGVRWWLASQKVGVDLGLGFHSTPSAIFADEHLKSWGIAAGVPIVLKSWPRVHFLFRPGILWQSQEVETTAPPAAFNTDTEKTLEVIAELEGEAFLLDNFSVSASEGIAYKHFDPIAGDSESSFGTVGGDFAHVGFHVYLFR